MSTTTTTTKLRRNSRIRRALKAPDRPVAIRREYITDRKTTLVLRPVGDSSSEISYSIADLDGIPQFTVTGRKFSNRPCREFRDASGLPLFELHRKISFRQAWNVCLPGSKKATIASAVPRRSFSATQFGNFDLAFENFAAFECKGAEDKKVNLEIEKHGNVLKTFDVVDGDRKIAEIRESIPHNRTLALMPESRRGWRPIMDIDIMPEVDISLATVIAVIASDYCFSANYC
ncbi:uncharacterized protein LDX57_005007 [Aspergillus melleus]|uniref:uncharacterized protein n=1 Tax=Aspergillus melleus TaxID=138277 RepID=UPI001E8E2647|nr:uncharacterized protein LDX57_005007 [Aspergillus melleus]KAH8427293.1 hypothetical protein LDX57_005007 [Aspergillus melleus]